MGYPFGAPFAVLAQKLGRRREERIFLERTTDDDHRMRAHDVDHCVTAKLRQMIRADDRIIAMTPHVVYARFKLYDIVNARLIF